MQIGKNLIIIVLYLTTACACSAQSNAQRFTDSSAALARLEQVVETSDRPGAEQLFGKEGTFLLYSGDETLDRWRAKEFAKRFNDRHELQKKGDTFVLLLGQAKWPFPVPLVNDGRGWYFDARAGKEEILNRRVGENELKAMQTARTISYAQKLYASRDFDEDGSKEYARKIISTPGYRDGLYWEAGDGEEQSPLGPAIAQAGREGYSIGGNQTPGQYYGYIYRLFTEPSPDNSSPGNFWLVARPAVHGESGVFSFAINERGWLYHKPERDAGIVSVSGTERFAPDSTWTRIE